MSQEGFSPMIKTFKTQITAQTTPHAYGNQTATISPKIAKHTLDSNLLIIRKFRWLIELSLYIPILEVIPIIISRNSCDLLHYKVNLPFSHHT